MDLWSELGTAGLCRRSIYDATRKRANVMIQQVDLTQYITRELGVTEGQAKQGAGLFFFAVRMGISADQYTRLKDAFPGLADLVKGAMLVGGGRTGEMLSLIGPEALEQNLKGVGFNDEDIPKLGAIMSEAVVEAMPEITDQVASTLAVAMR